MTNGSVLYLGDTSLRGAACYLAGLMTKWGWSYDHLPSDQPVTPSMIDPSKQLFIISDYPSKLFEPSIQQKVLDRVSEGAGLLMIGGWDSFHGQGGHWAHTPIADALPVHIADQDDRINCDQPALARCVVDHPITQGLPWNDRPPTIGGFNRFEAKADAQVLLEVHRFSTRWNDRTPRLVPLQPHPLLVVGEHGKGQGVRGRTTALAGDVAPHWVGGLVDWGDGRVTAQAPGAYEIEVGDQYAAFFKQLLGWTGRLMEE